MGLGKCHIFHRYLAALFLALVFVPAWAQDASNTSTAAGDNTKINQRDQNKSESTADQQKNNRSDLDITKEIRHSLTQDKSLSTYAHNVKVITQDDEMTVVAKHD
jgi:hyperosmotically inducible protein